MNTVIKLGFNSCYVKYGTWSAQNGDPLIYYFYSFSMQFGNCSITCIPCIFVQNSRLYGCALVSTVCIFPLAVAVGITQVSQCIPTSHTIHQHSTLAIALTQTSHFSSDQGRLKYPVSTWCHQEIPVMPLQSYSNAIKQRFINMNFPCLSQCHNTDVLLNQE